MWPLIIIVCTLYVNLVVPTTVEASDLDLTKINITESTLKSYNITLCCPGDNVVDTTIKNCRDDEPWQINCEHGMYVINPKDSTEGVILIKADRFLYQEQFDLTVIPSEYCITNFKNATLIDTVQMVFICYDIESADSYYWVFVFRGILAFISVFFLVMTLYIYYRLPDLRETQDKLTIFAVICSTMFLFLLGLLQVTPGVISMYSCVVIAYFMLFFVLAHFAWLNMVMANVWKITVMRRWKVLEKYWFLFAHMYAWGMPTLVIVVALIGHHSSLFSGPGFGVQTCWFGNRDEAYNFLYIPMSIMLAINVVFFVWSAYVLLKLGPDMSIDRKRALSYRCKLYVALFGISGLTWIFEILSHHFQRTGESSWYWYLADLINTLYGVFTFIILIVWRKRVRKSLAGKQILCFTMPTSWCSSDGPEEETLQEGRQMMSRDHDPEYIHEK